MPQIELMQSDLPHTLYLKEHGVDGSPSANDIDEATRLFNEAQKRKAEKQGSYTIDEIFNGDADED